MYCTFWSIESSIAWLVAERFSIVLCVRKEQCHVGGITDTFYAIGGNTNTAANYTWTGTQNFQNTVTFSDINSIVTAKAGVNNFLNPAARDAALTSPVRGTICLIRQNASGSTVDEVQYYNGTIWVPVIIWLYCNGFNFTIGYH